MADAVSYSPGPPSDSLAGRVALVTGAGRNIGRAVALGLARQGASVIVNARADELELKSVTDEIKALGGFAAGIVGDIGSRIEVDRIAREAAQPFGSIDILVNSAAIRPGQPFLEITDDDWDRVLNVNLSAPYRFAQALLPEMIEKGWGRIINFSGRDSFERPRGRAHVTVTKNGIVGLTRVLAMEFAPHGITVNTVAPGSFNTSRTLEWPMGDDRTLPAKGTEGNASRLPPTGRLGEPGEIADLCAFLASPRSSFVNGQTLHINGGQFVT